jgi:hypothetical protein
LGVVTNRSKWVNGFDMYFYPLKHVNGKISDPAINMYNIVSCFGDNKTASEKPSWIATSPDGKATRENRVNRFCWDWLCPTNEEYISFLLKLIKKTSREDVKGIHLDCVEFPGEKYCNCRRCAKKWKRSALRWAEWKQEVITEFVKRASMHVSQEFSTTLYPDPFCPERFGIDLEALAEYVDFFIIPIYDKSYSTTYWIEILVKAFRKRLNVPFYVELYAREPKVDNLHRAAVAAFRESYGIVFAYGVQKAVEVQDRLKKEAAWGGV